MSNGSPCGLYALVPNPVTGSTFYDSPVAEPDPNKVMPDGSLGEVEWVSHPSNVLPINCRRIRTTTHRVYLDTTGGVSQVAPENDPIRWFDEGPTNKWAWADTLAATQTEAASPAQWTLDPGAATELELFGLSNVDTVRLQVYTGPAGPGDPLGDLVSDETKTTEEYTSSDPHWELYFRGPAQGRTVSFNGLDIAPTGRVVVTLTSYNGETLGVGLMAFGVYDYLGLAQFGFEALYRNYSYEEIDRWGNEVYRPGRKAKDLRGEAFMDAGEARGVSRSLERLMDTGAVFVPSTATFYTYLKTWGRLQPATIQAAGPGHAIVSIDVRGKI